MRRRRILFTGFSARIEDTKLPKCVIFGELVGGSAGCVGGGREKLLDDLRACGINADQWTTAAQDAGMAQDGGTRGGTFHGEMDRCRESQGWTTACSSMPKRDGKDQGDDSPKQACSCWFARHG